MDKTQPLLTCKTTAAKKDTDIDDGEQQVRNNSEVFSAFTPWLCRRPKQRIQNILTK